MSRAFLFILDSFGIGAAPDADKFGDKGADTLGHIAEACANGAADKPGLRRGPLNLPNMARLGLGLAAQAYRGTVPPGLEMEACICGQWGYAVEQSSGKDTPSGHWEIAGLPVPFEWGYFPNTLPAFPRELIAELTAQAGLPGVLGDKHASGTQIIADLGEEHITTGKPIVYTSADSVFQIAAHEDAFGLTRLYEVCEIARGLVDPLNIGRVIARPFTGRNASDFVRTANRKDYATPPFAPTLLDHLSDAGRQVISIGKIGDIFAHSGTGETIKANGNAELFEVSGAAARRLDAGGLIITNFVDFDALYGHRRDVAGYAAALERFDERLPAFQAAMRNEDLLILTADHGCDPTWKGTDHTRECVPVLVYGGTRRPGPIGRRESFADIGQTVAHHLKIAPLDHGKSWL